jgi:hypothetical protein
MGSTPLTTTIYRAPPVKTGYVVNVALLDISHEGMNVAATPVTEKCKGFPETGVSHVLSEATVGGWGIITVESFVSIPTQTSTTGPSVSA